MSLGTLVCQDYHSSESITTQTSVLVLEKNCKFEPLIHKIGRIKRAMKDMSELMDEMTKYVEPDKSIDPKLDEEKYEKGTRVQKEDQIWSLTPTQVTRVSAKPTSSKGRRRGST